MASSAASTSAPSSAQPTIDAIQQQISALLPSNLASAITSQFAGAPAGSVPVQPSTVGAMPAMTFSSSGSSSGSSTGSGSDGSASTGASLAQPTINAIQQQISALLPSSLASAITAQFPGSSSSGGATLPVPAAASTALVVPSSDLINTFLSLPQST